MHYVDLDFVVQDLNTAPTKVAGRYCMHSHQTRTHCMFLWTYIRLNYYLFRTMTL
jgi:hypothetical protein